MAYPYERKPANQPTLGSGVNESNTAEFSGLRCEHATLAFGGPTSRMGFDAAAPNGVRIIDAAVLTAAQTYPVTLTQRPEVGSPAATGGMQFMPVPMAVTVNLVSGVISTDRVAL